MIVSCITYEGHGDNDFVKNKAAIRCLYGDFLFLAIHLLGFDGLNNS